MHVRTRHARMHTQVFIRMHVHSTRAAAAHLALEHTPIHTPHVHTYTHSHIQVFKHTHTGVHALQ